jgi:hypothetical protein
MATRVGPSNVLVLVVALIAIVTLAVGGFLGVLLVGGTDAASTPLITTLFGFLGTIITALVVALRVEQTNANLEQHTKNVDNRLTNLNDTVENGVKNAAETAATIAAQNQQDIHDLRDELKNP